MTSLNPTMKIGQQIAEAILIHDKRKQKNRFIKSIELMELVGIEHAQERYHSYPNFRRNETEKCYGNCTGF